MHRRPTSFDIASLAGVSQPTVSRALRGSPSVRPATRARILAIAEQIGYKVDKNASNLRKQRSNTLALLIFEDPTPDNSLINPFFLSMIGSVTRTCARRGYDLLISFQQLSGNWHLDYEDSRKADGIILLGYGDYITYRPRLEQLVSQGTHFVLWGPAGENQLGAVIGCDNRQGGTLAAEHLIKCGRRNIAFIGDTSSSCPEFLERYRGFAEVCDNAGIIRDPALQVAAISTEESGRRAVGELLSRKVSFDAVFAASDLIAIGAMHALQERGLRVPEDVAIVGFDDVPAASLTNPPLTTVMQDLQLAGEVLVDTLIAQIEEERVESRVLPTRLVVRRSCGSA